VTPDAKIELPGAFALVTAPQTLVDWFSCHVRCKDGLSCRDLSVDRPSGRLNAGRLVSFAAAGLDACNSALGRSPALSNDRCALSTPRPCSGDRSGLTDRIRCVADIRRAAEAGFCVLAPTEN